MVDVLRLVSGRAAAVDLTAVSWDKGFGGHLWYGDDPRASIDRVVGSYWRAMDSCVIASRVLWSVVPVLKWAVACTVFCVQLHGVAAWGVAH